MIAHCSGPKIAPMVDHWALVSSGNEIWSQILGAPNDPCAATYVAPAMKKAVVDCRM